MYDLIKLIKLPLMPNRNISNMDISIEEYLVNFAHDLEANNQSNECKQARNVPDDKHVSKFEEKKSFNFNERNKSVKTPKRNRKFAKFLDTFTYLENC